MCRFLLVKSNKKIKPKRYLDSFSSMCERSRTPDCDRQGDGWGIAIKSQKSKIPSTTLSTDISQEWILHKYLDPIWKNQNLFSQFPEARLFAVHARSASFPKHKGDLEYNQPFIEDEICFVFNGIIKGVRLKLKLKGTIGAQKIFSLIKLKLMDNKPEKALKSLFSTMHKNAKVVEGMNVGLIGGDKFHILCDYEKNRDYFSLYYYQGKDLTLVCSEPLSDIVKLLEWQVMNKGEIRVL